MRGRSFICSRHLAIAISGHTTLHQLKCKYECWQLAISPGLDQRLTKIN